MGVFNKAEMNLKKPDLYENLYAIDMKHILYYYRVRNRLHNGILV